MTAPWTPRERALREALEFYAKHEHWMQVCEHADNSRILIANGKYHTNGDGWEEAAAALADQPPPDPRDEALGAVEAVLDTIIMRLENVDNGTVIIAQSGLAAIAAAKGEK